MKIPSMMIIVRVIFLVKKNIYILFTSFIGWMFVWNIFVKSKNEFKKVNVKNCAYYYFDDIMEIEDINVDNILLDEKSYKNILLYNTVYKEFMDAKLLRISLNKIGKIIKIYHGNRYLELCSWYKEVYYRINFRIYNAIFHRIK